SLHLAKCCFSKNLDKWLNKENNKTNNDETVNQSNSPIYGLPFVITFLNIHTVKDFNKILYQQLYFWIPKIFDKILHKLNIKPKANNNINENSVENNISKNQENQENKSQSQQDKQNDNDKANMDSKKFIY